MASNYAEPLLQPVGALIPTTVSEQKVVQDARGKGCCHMSNNFYLTLTFGVVFTNVCIFMASFLVLLTYSFPSCFACETGWAHLSLLTINQKIILYGALVYLLCYVIMGVVCLRGLLTERRQMIIPFFFVLVVTELAIVTFGILTVVYGPSLVENRKQELEQATMDDMYVMLGSVFKPNIVKLIQTVVEIRDVTIDPAQINYDAFFANVFEEEVLILSTVFRNMMIVGCIILGVGVNMLILFACVLIVKVIHRMNTFQQYMEQVEKQAPPEPDYFAYSPTHQFYSTNSSPVKTNLSRQSSYRKRHSTALRQNKEDFLM